MDISTGHMILVHTQSVTRTSLPIERHAFMIMLISASSPIGFALYVSIMLRLISQQQWPCSCSAKLMKPNVDPNQVFDWGACSIVELLDVVGAS